MTSLNHQKNVVTKNKRRKNKGNKRYTRMASQPYPAPGNLLQIELLRKICTWITVKHMTRIQPKIQNILRLVPIKIIPKAIKISTDKNLYGHWMKTEETSLIVKQYPSYMYREQNTI